MSDPNDMERAGKFIGKLKFPDGTVSDEMLACAAWSNAVGKKIAAHARAARMVRSTLIVEVEDAVWQRQLFSLRHQIRQKVDEAIGSGVVEEVEFRIVPPRRGPERARHANAVTDEASGIADPVLRRIYKASRKRETA
jgi:hypothetical protein